MYTTHPLAVLAFNPGVSHKGCEESDTELAKWTILRYLVIAAIVGYSVWEKMDKSQSMRKWPREFFIAGCNFAYHEGVGFLIYFGVSAAMDNFAIFFEDGVPYCAYVKMTALYSMSLVTFLPACWFAYRFQGRWFDEGTWTEKIVFIVAMVALTVLTFVVRLFLVYEMGYAKWVRAVMNSLSFKIFIAVLVPPVVDGLQTALLIACSLKTKHEHVTSKEQDAQQANDGAVA